MERKKARKKERLYRSVAVGIVMEWVELMRSAVDCREEELEPKVERSQEAKRCGRTSQLELIGREIAVSFHHCYCYEICQISFQAIL